MRSLPDFALERWFARFEFTARWNLCASDVEGMPLAGLLALADDETRALWDGLALGYTESAGHPLLRAEIAGLHDTVDPEEVLVCAGAEEAILLLITALAAPGETIACITPAYGSLHEVARAAGAAVAPIPLDPDDGWRPDLDALRAALDAGARAVVVNWPHNPTGALVDRDTFAEIARMTHDAGATLVSDEVYRLLEHDPADRLPAAADLSQSAAGVGVMSKAFGLAGLRIGWIATRDGALLRRAAALKDYTSICSSAPSEILAIVALRARERVLARSHAIVAANLPLLEAFVADHTAWLRWVPPRGGTVAFPALLGHGPVEDFAERLVAEEGVLILPGTVFGDRGDRFRIGLGRPDMPEGLARLGRFLSARRAPHAPGPGR